MSAKKLVEIIALVCKIHLLKWIIHDRIILDPRYCYTTTHNIGGIEFGKFKRIPHLCAIAKCERTGNIQITGYVFSF